MQTAIITGGAGGMGLATARILGRDHAVVIADVSQDRLDSAVEELRSEGIDATAVVCDITSRDSVDALIATGNATGELRAVVHAAGVSPLMGDASMIARINAIGTVNVVEAALEVAGEGFAVVNVASIAGHMTPKALQPARTFRLALTDFDAFAERLDRRVNRGPRKMRSGQAYSTSKSFVIWYSRAMAAAFGAKRARIVSVSPGSFDTAMGRLEEASGSGKLLDYAALKRFGRPEEVAEVLAFCASDGPGYLTGTDILVDGGTKAGLTLKGMIAMARG
ncbi:SDR family oxidoreductase [Demequina mangrovi]|uniref:NAD(P)-dependent dehydrogenase, short-chain alcohol dehydrogenase family n=1 Tax=Demequina mangrovi TaxID=1043493 RepID=A0A1H6YYS7_9MICO|nr:SDR family oxidoreductase [Demequina mangrovi]SEJ45536.1 NAD(P)-dependent dehydrogenase, short-chain alcohol dehydrogenase family [Demequina mangrovi]